MTQQFGTTTDLPHESCRVHHHHQFGSTAHLPHASCRVHVLSVHHHTLSRSLFTLFQVLALASVASSYQPQNLIVVGGGAAGLFGAINACERAKSLGTHLDCVVFEQGPTPLSKVRISGGGRCNVMHDDTKSPEELANTGYPRGSRELLGPITSRFGAVEASSWFRSRGVALKTESDGRMFPVSDNSETIAECLLDAARQAGVRIVTQGKVTDVRRACGEEEADTHRGRAGGAVPLSTSGGREGQDARTGVSPMFEVDVKIGGSSTSFSSRSGTQSETFQAHMVLVSPGASKQAWAWLERMGHPIEPPVPSLFTLTLEECRKNDGAGAPLLPARGGGGRVGDHEEEETEKGGGEGGVEAPTSAREAAPWLADLAGVTVPHVTLALLDTPPPATTVRAQAPGDAVRVPGTGRAGGDESSGGECARRGSGTDESVSSGGSSVDSDDAAAAKEQTEGKTKKRRNNKKKKAKKAKALVVRSGPLLLTHSGISGPAALRLSAWGARHLANSNYRANVVVNWCSSSIAGGGRGGGGGSGVRG